LRLDHEKTLYSFPGAVGLLLATASGTALANTKTVVLVHGAFADGSGWNRVIDQLQRQHTEVIAVQLPLVAERGCRRPTRHRPG
jgi:alpha-beta hydrolase superfamily lysophospholipase